MENGVDFSSIEVLARMTDTKIEAREICDRWLLITYDIPNTEAGNKARRDFLSEARLIGASRYTDSVYLMPWTKHAEILALGLARAGEVCVWTSQTTDNVKAAEITKNYDKGLEPQLDEISERIDKIEYNVNHDRMKRANKMLYKTDQMLENMEQAIIRRGSAQLYVLLTILKQRFQIVARRASGKPSLCSDWLRSVWLHSGSRVALCCPPPYWEYHR